MPLPCERRGKRSTFRSVHNLRTCFEKASEKVHRPRWQFRKKFPNYVYIYIYIYPLFFFILLLFSVICNPRYSTFSFKRKTELKLKRRIYSNLNKIGKKNWEPTNNLRLLPINPPSIVYTESTSSFSFSLYFFFKLCFFLKTIKVKRSNRICWTIL